MTQGVLPRCVTKVQHVKAGGKHGLRYCHTTLNPQNLYRHASMDEA